MTTAVITGAAQGLGLETARQLAARGMDVVVTARDADRAAKAAAGIGDEARSAALDVASQSSVDALFDRLADEGATLGVVVNAAGRIYGAYSEPGLGPSADEMAEAIDNNALGAWRVMQRAIPLMQAARGGNIVNVSSGMGALTDMGSGAMAYRVSKTVMNALTILGSHAAGPTIRVNAVCPGWVRTEMGGASASRSVEEGAAGIVWAATLGKDGPRGGFFRDGRAIDW